MTSTQAVIVAIAMSDDLSYKEAERFWGEIQGHKDLPHSGDCTKECHPCLPCCYRMMVEDGARLEALLRDSQERSKP